jgi:uncharacterized damage-inducible protein DinB
MTERQDIVASNRRAVGAFLDAVRTVRPEQWATPRAPGKWSPGQVTEHVMLAYEQSLRMLRGTFTGPAQPWYAQLFARWLGLPGLLKRGDFGKGPLQAPAFIQPGETPASSVDLVARLEAAAGSLEGDLAAASDARPVSVDHPIFGRLPLADLLHFLLIHTNHHRPQLV